ncbi:class F sortase [Streptomyces sp. NPDC055078]
MAATAATGCSGDTGTSTGTSTRADANRSAEAPPSATDGAPAPGDGKAAGAGKGSAPAPVQVSIPSIGVTSSLMRLGLNKDRTVEVPPPEKGMTAGWYSGAAVPGEPGASVIIGHNATRFGKAVFHDLKKIGKGAEIAVRNSAGKTARFAVTGTETVKKNAFPTQKVYGGTNGRELRLITCDGGFDAQGHPVDNLIVYATLR